MEGTLRWQNRSKGASATAADRSVRLRLQRYSIRRDMEGANTRQDGEIAEIEGNTLKMNPDF